MFFDGWMTLGRTALVGTLAYLALVLLLRVSGKRTLSKMNAFDFVVTVALGSTLATVLLSSSVSLARGVLAFTVLILLQLVITWLSARSPAVRRLIKAEPTLLVHKGEFLAGAMKRERVTEEEVRAALRSKGVSRSRRWCWRPRAALASSCSPPAIQPQPYPTSPTRGSRALRIAIRYVGQTL